MLLRIKNQAADTVDQNNKMTIVDTLLILTIYSISLGLFVLACAAVFKAL